MVLDNYTDTFSKREFMEWRRPRVTSTSAEGKGQTVNKKGNDYPFWNC